MEGKFNIHFTGRQTAGFTGSLDTMIEKVEGILKNCPVITEPKNPTTTFFVSLDEGSYQIINPEIKEYKFDEEFLEKFKDLEIKKGKTVYHLYLNYWEKIKGVYQPRSFFFLKT